MPYLKMSNTEYTTVKHFVRRYCLYFFFHRIMYSLDLFPDLLGKKHYKAFCNEAENTNKDISGL